MDDMFNENQQREEREAEIGSTRVIEPVSADTDAKPARRRRTERFAGLIDEADSVIPAPFAAPVNPAEEAAPADGEAAPQATQATPAVRDVWKRDNKIDTNAFAGVRVPARPEAQAPSQGVPRPAALSGQQPHRAQAEQTVQNTPIVRRPVEAEGYAPLQQLGTQEQPRVRRPDQDRTVRQERPVRPERPARQELSVRPGQAQGQEAPRRIRTPESERIAYEDVPEQEEKGGNRGLIAVIIALLVLAALILGLIMIPEEDTGVLGTFKRAVTEPVKELLGVNEDEDDGVPARADSFTATISQATAPYKVVFHMVTSSGVTAVRVVDEQGNVIPTVTTLSAPNSETTIVWMFELTRDTDFDGVVAAQMQDDGLWIDTGLTQKLSLGAVATVTGAPVATTLPATDAPSQPAATPTHTPEAVIAAVVENSTPAPATDVPEQTPEVTATPEATATPEVTATPTLSVTATPTLVPTATPTAEPTEEPTPEPTAEPTPEPTAEPTATPVVTPKLEAMAEESADPKLISTQVIYKDGKKVSAYEREKPMNMPASDAYLTRAFGVTTFRGNAFRQNAAVDYVDSAESLSLLWTAEAGSVAGSSRNYYGIGWSGQPVIAKWPSDIRKGMELEQARKDQKNLKEVIVAGMDGKIYFLDLLDGSATREAIDFGYPMRSTPSLHPLSYPMMTVGQYARKMKSGTGDNIGLYYYNLMDQKQLRLIDGLDRKLERPYYSVGAFDTSALIDRNTNTLIAVGTNGLLYTETLSMDIYGSSDGSGIVYKFEEPTETVTLMSHTKGQKEALAAVESSLAMYGSYAYYADMDGILRCVDTTTMTTAWAVDTGDAVRAAIALDLEEGEGTNTLWLYTANLVNVRSKGDVTIRRFNAMTGEEDWAFAIHCAEGKKKDVTFNSVIVPGAMASPVVGQNSLKDLVYFTLSSVSATGAKTLSGDSAMAGVIIALDKNSGEVVWHKEMEAYCYSSPVAVYDEAGKGWIIQACSNGTIYLMDGLTGDTVSTLSVNGVIEASPAVYGDTLVIGTTGKDTSYIYGIKIN